MKIRQSERGFTLIELVISVTIMSVVVLGVSQMWLVSIKANIRASQKSQASYLAQAKMEELRSKDYGELTETGETGISVNEFGDETLNNLYNGKYFVSEIMNNGEGAALREIKVNVWRKDDEINKIELVTWKARR